ncbi:c-type cytochrome [Chelativorans sp. YIM 93263]|uniref:c-type cytochrome n=1 Tax=Chelativorans sp. YIM 93263 TaxID=2906648 RepID=UPI0023784326|nr:cytochrome c [Chelativorans sp. YIM 93263]
MRYPMQLVSIGALFALGTTIGAIAQEDSDPQAQEQAMEEQAPTESFADPERFVYEDGEALYRSACQGCHMPEGEGAVGAGEYPALSGNPMLEDPAYPAYVIIHGQRAMPAFGQYYDDEQVAALVNFIRSELGNDFEGDATAEDVATYR